MKKNYVLGGLLGFVTVALVVSVFSLSSSTADGGTFKGSFTPSHQFFRNQGVTLDSHNITFSPQLEYRNHVTLNNPTNEQVNISWRQVPEDPAFTIQGIPRAMGARATTVISFTFNPVVANDYRLHTSQIIFFANGTPTVLNLSGQKVPPYTISQPMSGTVDFGEVYAGRTATKEFTIQNQTAHVIHFTWNGLALYRDENGRLRQDHRAAFGIYSIDVPGFDVPALSSHTVTMAFSPRSSLQHYAMNISLTGDGLTTNFNLVGTARSPFMVSPITVNFPPTAVGNTSFATFTIRNVSDRDIQINLQPVVLQSPDLRIANETQFTVGASRDYVVTLSFTPTRASTVYDQRAGALVYFNAAGLGADIMIRATSTPR